MRWQEPCGSTFVVAPEPYRGNWTDLNGDGYLEYDFAVFGIEPDPNPFEVVASGPGGSMKWTTPNPNTFLPWTHFRIPIRPSAWTVTSGSFAAILANVTEFKIRVRIFNDLGWGTVIGIDSVAQGVDTNYVPPASYTVLGGLEFGGSLASLQQSDDEPLMILCDDFDSNSVLECTATSPVLNPGSLKFVTETSSSRNDLIELPQLFDNNTSGWTMVGGSMSTIGDTRKTSMPSGDLSRFIRQSDGQIRSRLNHIPSADISAMDGWIVKIDQIQFRVAN